MKEQLHSMGHILTYAAYLSFIAFLGRFVIHIVSWFRGAGVPSDIPVFKKMTPGKVMDALLDIFLFRRLFKTSKLLWTASWAFHLSLLLVLLRHSWYFLDPVPDLIVFIEPAGIKAGYVLPLSLIFIFIIRISRGKDRYLSFYNFFIIGVLFIISLIGLVMGYVFEPDVLDVKDFVSGILTLSPSALPESPLFIVHFILVLILIPFLPFHLITAPVITVEARRREKGLELVLHEK